MVLDRLIILGNGGDEFLNGADGSDQVNGGDDNDDLQGGAGDDALIGGAGNDTLSGDFGFFGPAGADTLTGGAGADLYGWQIGNAASTSLAQDRVTDFEGAGAAGGDTLELELPSTSIGGWCSREGWRRCRRSERRFPSAATASPRCSETCARVVTATRSSGSRSDLQDTVSQATRAQVSFYAFAGGDTTVFADSNDNGLFDADDFAARLTGRQALVRSDFGTTDFVVRGTNGADSINGTVAADTISALGGADTVNDAIDGGNGADRLNGGAGRDRVNGGSGADTVNGGGDGDFLTGDAGNDLVGGAAGDDNVDGDDVMRGGAGEDSMVGGDGNDAMFGEADDDSLQGAEGNDAMFGGAGDDEIVGYEGIDLNQGGAGEDRFGFFLGTFAPSSTFAAQDIVLDFEGAGAPGGDVIDLNGEQVSFAGRVNIAPRVGAPLPGAGDGVTQLAYAQRNGDTWLFADENDNGRLDATDFTVRFEGSMTSRRMTSSERSS